MGGLWTVGNLSEFPSKSLIDAPKVCRITFEVTINKQNNHSFMAERVDNFEGEATHKAKFSSSSNLFIGHFWSKWKQWEGR